MTNRFPLVLDADVGNKIKELPNGDSLNLTGNAIVGVSNISITGELTLTSTGIININGGIGSTLAIGGTSALSLRSSSNIDLQASVIPNVSGSYDIGSNAARFSSGYFNNTVTSADFATNASDSTFTLVGGLNIVPGSTTDIVKITGGGLGIPSTTTTDRNNLPVLQPGYMIHNSTTNAYQAYVGTGAQDVGPGWINLSVTYGDEPISPYPGMLAVASGNTWDPKGTGAEAFMVYLNAAWVVVA